MNYKLLVGRTFGAIRILSAEKDRNTKMPYLKAICKCGNIGELRNTSLTFEENPNCMCHAFHQIEHSFNKEDKAFLSLLNSYKKRINDKGLTCDLNLRSFKKFSMQNCEYCGIEPQNTLTYCGVTYKYNGIDRIINTSGYVVENMVTACFICNKAKGNMSLYDFMVWANRLNTNSKTSITMMTNPEEYFREALEDLKKQQDSKKNEL